MLCHIKPWWYDSQPPFVTILYGEALLYCSCRSFNRRTSRKWFCCGFCCCLKSQFRIIVFLNVICLLSQHRFPPLIVSFGKRIFLCKGRNQIVVFSFRPTLIRAQAWCCEYQESSRHVERMMFKLNGTFSYNQWKWGLWKSHQWWGKWGITIFSIHSHQVYSCPYTLNWYNKQFG